MKRPLKSCPFKYILRLSGHLSSLLLSNVTLCANSVGWKGDVCGDPVGRGWEGKRQGAQIHTTSSGSSLTPAVG